MMGPCGTTSFFGPCRRLEEQMEARLREEAENVQLPVIRNRAKPER
jgi:hypothetical protein